MAANISTQLQLSRCQERGSVYPRGTVRHVMAGWRSFSSWGIPRGIPWHFDNFFPKMYTLISHFSFKFGSCGYRGPWFRDLRFLSYSIGQFSEVSLQRCFRGLNWDIYSTKKSKQTIWLNWLWIREFNYDVYFVTLNDLDHATLKSCFLSFRATPGTPPISYFYPSKCFPMICLSRQKIKKCVFL